MSITETHCVEKHFWPRPSSYRNPSKRPKESIVPRQINSDSRASQPDRRPYVQRIQELAFCFPHLQKCLVSSRFSHQKYSVFDYYHHTLLSTRSQVTDRSRPCSTPESRTTFQHLAKDEVPSNLTHRVILVESLSTDLIELLGSELGVVPEFFEQHLINSGWQNGKDNDCEASSWNTRTLNRPYTSIRWLRSGVSNYPRKLTTQSRSNFLQPGGRLSWEENVLVTNREKSLTLCEIRHEATPAENILRPSWQIETDEGSEETSDPQPVLWEERASICVRQEANYQVGK